MRAFVQGLGGASLQSAFSLVEVVIALAVTAIAILAIVSLFPFGLNTASQSRRETRAGYLAEQLVSDLRSSPFTNAAILCRQADGTLAPLPTLYDLRQATTNFLTCDGDDNVLSVATSGQYESGIAAANASYLVEITVLPTAITNLSTVSVEVSAPAQAALSTRSRYGFQTMIGNRQ